MAAFRFLSVEKVRERVSRDQDEEMIINDEDEVTLTDKIKECLKMVNVVFFLAVPGCLFWSLSTTLVGEELQVFQILPISLTPRFTRVLS